MCSAAGQPPLHGSAWSRILRGSGTAAAIWLRYPQQLGSCVGYPFSRAVAQSPQESASAMPLLMCMRSRQSSGHTGWEPWSVA
jgi:hypothetical protein